MRIGDVKIKQEEKCNCAVSIVTGDDNVKNQKALQNFEFCLPEAKQKITKHEEYLSGTRKRDKTLLLYDSRFWIISLEMKKCDSKDSMNTNSRTYEEKKTLNNGS